MSILKNILDNYSEENLIILTGLDDAVIGIDGDQIRLIYSQTKILSILMERDNMTIEEAEEFFAYNIYSLNVGKHSPIYCLDNFIWF